MLKYTLLSYLILAIAMLYFANKMLGAKDNLQKKVLGSYYTQMEEINKETGMEVYDLDKTQKNPEEAKRAMYELTY